MISLQLSDLARVLGVAVQGADAPITGLAIDSRAVTTGDLFVAIRGDRVDGSDFIEKALARGAAAVVSSQALSHTIPHLTVADSGTACAAFGRLARESFDGVVVGITGSAGKTTAKAFLAAICACTDRTVATDGNQNNELGVPLTLAKLLSAPQFGVIEMGAAQRGDIAHLKNMALPQIVVLLNALEAHVGRFGSLDNIVATKGEILDGLSPSNVAVLNADQSNFAVWSARAQPARIISFGWGAGADVRVVSERSVGFKGSQVELDLNGSSVSVRLCVPGKGGVTNALAAAAAAIGLGIEVDKIVEGLESVKPVAGRGNSVTLRDGVTLIDDSYNASPSSVIAALDVLSTSKAPRTAVLADMLELGDEAVSYHQQVGRYISKLGIERVIAVGDLSRHIGDHCSLQSIYFQDADALLGACPTFSENETVLVKGSRGMHLDRFVDAVTSSLGETTC
ncbi:MAG: UDP-N-acetylmuramoyl-tripeptide--D-alanyl-D-alanine ligase [Halieaceae bacterium]|nr:UDP-N-acetylmuramoyl-tripeptide--D-alanyl-D-alanine ligase [Halieaceae bacterium]